MKLHQLPRSWMQILTGFLLIAGTNCLRNVELEVIPATVQHGQSAILRCHYDLENAPLYSVKWYRGRFEFYRYSPSENPATKIFNISGIHVDRDHSNSSQVTLRNVDFSLSGQVSCEVTADAPTFSTSSNSKNLTVLMLPAGKPIIASERERYNPGDTLKANCSLPPSKPPASLSFSLNDIPVDSHTKSKQYQPWQQKGDHGDEHSSVESENMQYSEVSLTLQSFHYVQGQLNLRCTAKIPDIYSSTSELQLGTGLREPKPERVTSENGSTISTAAVLSVVLIGIVNLLVR